MRRVAHLSADEPIIVDDNDSLSYLCGAVRAVLQGYGPERLYMIVNLVNFVIDPELAPAYAEKIGAIAEDYLYPNGLARYGYNMTRVTVRLSQADKIDPAAGLFSLRREA